MKKGISIVIPTYNRGKYLKDLLTCLAKQDYSPYEIIVVNDGSTDNTADLVEDFAEAHNNVTLVNQKNKGPAGARNAGIAKATYDIVAFTDDDCRPKPNWLSRLQSYFDKHPDILGVGGIMYTPDDQIKVLTHHAQSLEQAKKTQAKFPGTNNVAYKKSALKKVHGFNEHFKYVSTEDVDLFIRITQYGKVIFDTTLTMPHISRPISLRQAIRGYKAFYHGFKEIEAKYPDAFKKIYSQSTTDAMLSSHSNVVKLLKNNFKYYFPDILNPITLIKVIYYFLATRLFLLKMRLT